MLTDFNIKEKIKEFKRIGKKPPAEYFDLGIAYWLLNPDEGDYSLENLSKKFLHKDPAASSRQDLKGELYNYAVKKLKEYKLEKLFYDVEMPLVSALAEMEDAGIKIDSAYLKRLDKELDGEIKKLVKAIYKEAGGTFNINSPKQLGEILFKKLKIDIAGVKKTKTGQISTNEQTLSLIKNRHPIVKHLLEYRELFKLQSTYVRPLQELVGKDGRVHTTYIQTGTSTGRLSSQNPNLQNIPIEGAWGRKVRRAFIVEKGFMLAAFDYSQIELRVLASLSGDPKMMEAFNNDLDIHKLTAANVFNVSLEKVTPEMRRLAKTLNFGVVYGMGAFAFAKTSGLSAVEARKFIDEYFSDFKKIKEWQEEVKAQTRTFGYVMNLNGRRRWLLQAASMFRSEAAEAERAAINMPVQGLAADIIKIAMVKLKPELEKKGWYGNQVRMLLTIHDELLFEIKENIIKEAMALIRKIMESAYELEVPIKVTAKIGKNWGELD
ncbi:MAG: hypothetical protein HYY86_01410 [Candidatus Harrisonbacteria bacterium]|nr:hypothetical protein [Candidatus Harrisonbacteria bacterium]